MASDSALPIRITQTLGITASLVASGAGLAISAFVIPRILELPTPLLLKSWKNMFDQGKSTIPPMAVTSSALWFWLAYNSSKASPLNVEAGKVGKYITAGALCVGIIPYTFAILMPTNKKLFAKVEESRKLEGQEVSTLDAETAHKLVDNWGVLNLARGLMLLAGGVLGLWTSME